LPEFFDLARLLLSNGMNQADGVSTMSSTDQNVALPLRSHTILGVCEAIGEDFGINPLYLRVPLGAVVVVSIKWAVLTYLALGVAVLASRLIFPRAKAVATTGSALPVPANSDVEEKLAA
jgi:phage shock protein C